MKYLLVPFVHHSHTPDCTKEVLHGEWLFCPNIYQWPTGQVQNTSQMFMLSWHQDHHWQSLQERLHGKQEGCTNKQEFCP